VVRCRRSYEAGLHQRAGYCTAVVSRGLVGRRRVFGGYQHRFGALTRPCQIGDQPRTPAMRRSTVRRSWCFRSPEQYHLFRRRTRRHGGGVAAQPVVDRRPAGHVQIHKMCDLASIQLFTQAEGRFPPRIQGRYAPERMVVVLRPSPKVKKATGQVVGAP